MDPLVLAAASAVVTAMATDGWQQARTAVVELWRRVRLADVPAIEAELEEMRGELLAARAAGDRGVEEGLVADWQRKLHRLMSADPKIGGQLRRLLDEELGPLLSTDQQAGIGRIEQRAQASGHGRVYQAVRDQHIYEK